MGGYISSREGLIKFSLFFTNPLGILVFNIAETVLLVVLFPVYSFIQQFY